MLIRNESLLKILYISNYLLSLKIFVIKFSGNKDLVIELKKRKSIFESRRL